MREETPCRQSGPSRLNLVAPAAEETASQNDSSNVVSAKAARVRGQINRHVAWKARKFALCSYLRAWLYKVLDPNDL